MERPRTSHAHATTPFATSLRDGIDLRRLADVFLPRGPSGCVGAWDFTITSALRPAAFDAACFDAHAAFNMAWGHKCRYFGTAARCAGQGFAFCPLILGAACWGIPLRGWLALQQILPFMQRLPTLFITQRISCTIHRENARSILKRVPESPGICSVGLSLL